MFARVPSAAAPDYVPTSWMERDGNVRRPLRPPRARTEGVVVSRCVHFVAERASLDLTAMAQTAETDFADELAKELQKNRELVRTLYTLRGEAPPNEHGYAPALGPLNKKSAARAKACARALPLSARPLTESAALLPPQ